VARGELLLDFDPVSGLKEWISTDETTGESFIRYEQDVNPILDANKSAHLDGLDKTADMWHVASIPNVVLMKWMTEHGVDFFNPDHKDGVRKLLNSSDYAHLKRAPIVI
jgi:hypothetical protein